MSILASTEKEVFVIFYRRLNQQFKYLVFRDGQQQYQKSKYRFLGSRLSKRDDNYSSIFAASRIIISNFPQFCVECLIEKKPNLKECQSRDIDYSNFFKRFMCSRYYAWVTHFCEATNIYYWNTDDLAQQTFFIPLQDAALENLKSLTDCEERSYKEIQEDAENFEDRSKNLLQNNDFDDIIVQNQDFYQRPPDKSNTYILTLNKPKGLEKAKDGQPFMHTEGIYKGIYKRKLENWFTFNLGLCQYPPDDLLKVAKTLIIPGSSHSAYDTRHEWITKEYEFLQKIHKQFKSLKILGVCFGEQIIAQALGGNVGMLEERKKDPQFYLVGGETLTYSKEFFELDFIKKIGLTYHEKLNMVEAHGDVVEKIPEGFKVMAQSASGIEIFTSNDHRILAIQGHPEYECEWNLYQGSAYKSFFYKVPVEDALKSYEKDWRFQLENHNEYHRRICESFIKTDLPESQNL